MLELNKLYNLDCMEGMKDFPDKYFDLAIVDPPYGIKESAHRNISRSKLTKTKNYKKEIWDFKIPEQKYFDELFRISKHQIIWGVNYFTEKYLFKPGRIVWNKLNGDNNFSDCELAYQSYSKSINYFEYRWAGMMQGNMKHKEIRIHSCQKPIALYQWILKNYAKPDFKIIDTHAGSCSSVITFLDFGCQWIAFEIGKDSYESASKRIENHKMQLKLAI